MYIHTHNIIKAKRIALPSEITQKKIKRDKRKEKRNRKTNETTNEKRGKITKRERIRNYLGGGGRKGKKKLN